MRKSKLLLLLVFVLTPITSLAEPADPVTIAFIGPLSGAAASYGVASKNGIEMALEELPVAARPRVLFEDDMFDSKRTVSAFKRYTEVDAVDLVITIASTPSNAAAPLAQAGGIPLLAWASDTAVSLNRSFVIRTYPSGAAEGHKIAEEAAARKVGAVAVITSINDYPLSVRTGFTARYREVVLAEEVPAETRDFRPQILRAKAAKTRAVMLCLNPGSSGLFAKQARELQLDAQIFGCINLEDSNELALSGGALKGAWFVTSGVSQKFRERYQARFHNEDTLAGAAIHYDLMHMLSDIFSARIKGAKFIEAVLALPPYEGATGRYSFRREAGDQYLALTLVIKEL